MRILFVASLHHPEALQSAIAATPLGAEPPLFPPSMGQYLGDKALRKRGHTTDVFYRNIPAIGELKSERHSQGLTPGKIISVLAQRIPPETTLDYRLRNRRLLEKARTFKPDVLWM